MKKYFLSILLIATVSATSFAQTTKQKLDQVKNNPATTENAGKADAQLTTKKNVAGIPAAKIAAIKSKQQGCKLKRKKNSTRSSS
jgi:hypothetical protein